MITEEGLFLDSEVQYTRDEMGLLENIGEMNR